MREQVGRCVAWICTRCGEEGLKARTGDPVSHDCSRAQRIRDAEAAVIAAAEAWASKPAGEDLREALKLANSVVALHEARK